MTNKDANNYYIERLLLNPPEYCPQPILDSIIKNVKDCDTLFVGTIARLLQVCYYEPWIHNCKIYYINYITANGIIFLDLNRCDIIVRIDHYRLINGIVSTKKDYPR